MSLIFEKPRTCVRRRGLCWESQQTFHIAVAGEIEFGNYFAVVTQKGILWKWELQFPLGNASAGWADSEKAARSALDLAYDELLQRMRLAGSRQSKREDVRGTSQRKVSIRRLFRFVRQVA